MATSPQAAPGNNDNNHAAANLTVDSEAQDSNAVTATEKESDEFLNEQTSGQTFDENDSGQKMADQMDDSRRSEYQSPTGPAPASDQNVPDQLSHPSEAAYTLPEFQHQGKRLTAEGDDDK